MNALFADTYAALGFSENPFLVHALRPDDRGQRLLIGRDNEIRLVCQRLHKGGKVTCLDGQVGVGKTSLVNVAAHVCFQAFLTAGTTQLLIPMQQAFQLAKDEDASTFCSKVFRSVAQTLITHRELVRSFSGAEGISRRLEPWLNSPIVEHLNVAAGVQLGVGLPGIVNAGGKFDASTAAQVNTSPGFSEHGFEQMVRTWLDQIFGKEASGGVVCVIDNLELLESGAQARRTLEALRDRLFTVNGLRWAFCGANGVIHSLAASARLASYLNTPVIDVSHIAPGSIEPLLEARVREFSIKGDGDLAALPIRVQDLSSLYQIVNFNLRDFLASADEYCEHLHSTGKSPANEKQKAERFAKWLERATTIRYQALQSRLPNDAWAILDLAMSDEFRGTFGVGDYGSFNSNSKIAIADSTFEKRLRDLEKNGLISKSIDDEAASEDGFRRDVFNVTAKGAMVHYARLVRQETAGLKPTTWLRRVSA